jgi:hypothetical protein
MLHYKAVPEWTPPGLPMSVDVMITGRTTGGELRTVAVEGDGPMHFTHDGRRDAATRVRDALLLLHGIEVRIAADELHALGGALSLKKLAAAQHARASAAALSALAWLLEHCLAMLDHLLTSARTDICYECRSSLLLFGTGGRWTGRGTEPAPRKLRQTGSCSSFVAAASSVQICPEVA